MDIQIKNNSEPITDFCKQGEVPRSSSSGRLNISKSEIKLGIISVGNYEISTELIRILTKLGYNNRNIFLNEKISERLDIGKQLYFSFILPNKPSGELLKKYLQNHERLELLRYNCALFNTEETTRIIPTEEFSKIFNAGHIIYSQDFANRRIELKEKDVLGKLEWYLFGKTVDGACVSTRYYKTPSPKPEAYAGTIRVQKN